MSTSETKKFKRYLKFFLKVAIAGGIIWFVYTKIDSKNLVPLILDADYIWLLPATFFFALSKFIGAWRLQHFLKLAEVKISFLQNLKLYWLGMFYNLFLPGGIGGDGYKVYMFHKKQGIPTKKAIAPMLLDRANGMYSLYLWIVVLAWTTFDLSGIPWLHYSMIASLPLSIAVCVFVLKKWFPTYPKIFFITLGESLAVQGAQIICLLCLLKSLGAESHYIEYSLTFLVSSVVSIVPVTPGGVGLREATFKYAADFVEINPEVGVLCGSLFMAITLAVSFVGIIYHFNQKNLVPETKG